KAGLAVAGGAQARAAVHARRDAQFDLGGLLALAFAVAGLARLLDDAPGAFAMRAGLRNAEDAARSQHLAAPAAGRAGLDFGAVLHAGASAGLALVELGDGNFLLGAERGLFERDFQIVTQIVAALRGGR